jgi:acyl-coenzyme A thioesterase PaaI-like protein
MNLLHTWNRLQKWPAGKKIFSFMLGKKIPYSGTIRPQILELESGHAKVQLADRKAVRNHLNSIHAVALMNLGELSSGLSIVAGLSPQLRAILTGFRMEYLKKARGTLTADARCTVPTANVREEHIVSVDIKNEQGDTVCRAHATWLVGPV